MSNIYSNHSELKDKKKISIRPININRSEDSQTGIEKRSEKKQLETEIDQAYKKLQQIKEEQSKLLKQTQADIEAAKTAWDKEKETYISQANEKGYKEGFAEGEQHGLDQYKQLISEANEAVDAARSDYYAALEQSEEEILKLAVHISEKILHQQLDDQPDRFLSLVRAAIKEVKDKPEITIYLNPANYQFVVKQKEELAHFNDRELNISIYANEELNEGSCLIEHPFGQVDASIDMQLQELRDALYNLSMENSQ